MALDSMENIIVASFKGHIMKYGSKNGQEEVLVRCAQIELFVICGIALDRANNIYCVDKLSGRAMKCDQDGGNVRVHHLILKESAEGITILEEGVFLFEKLSPGTILVCNRDLQLTRCIHHSGMAIDAPKNMYICDHTKSLIRVFNIHGVYQRNFWSWCRWSEIAPATTECLCVWPIRLGRRQKGCIRVHNCR